MIRDLKYDDIGNLHKYSLDYCVIFMDKNHVRAAEDLKAVHFSSSFAYRALTITEAQQNWEVSSVRAILKNYSGRMPSVFIVLWNKSYWKKPLSNNTFGIWLPLTTCETKEHPFLGLNGQHFMWVLRVSWAYSLQPAQKRRIFYKKAVERRRVQTRFTKALFLFDHSDYFGFQKTF